MYSHPDYQAAKISKEIDGIWMEQTTFHGGNFAYVTKHAENWIDYVTRNTSAPQVEEETVWDSAVYDWLARK
jgi:hypothetical protein